MTEHKMGKANSEKYVVPPGTVVITGAQGHIQSDQAVAIARHYGKRQVVDNWTIGTPIPDDAIALTSETRLVNAIRFKNAMNAAGIVTFGC